MGGKAGEKDGVRGGETGELNNIKDLCGGISNYITPN